MSGLVKDRLCYKKPIIMALDEQTCPADQVTASYHWLQVWRMGVHRAQSRLSLLNVAFETQPTPLCQVLQNSRLQRCIIYSWNLALFPNLWHSSTAEPYCLSRNAYLTSQSHISITNNGRSLCIMSR